MAAAKRVERSVFISYRRTNFPWALNIYQNLHHNGYDVFFDFEGVGPGDFESIILDNIVSRAHFVVVLTPSALERCSEPHDWVRREIETAIETRRNIIPLMLEGFNFDSPFVAKQLTGPMAALKTFNGLTLPAEYFLDAMDKLRNRYLNVPVAATRSVVAQTAQKAATEQMTAARAAPPVRLEELTAQQFFERAYATRDLDEKIRLLTESLKLNPEFGQAQYDRAIALKARGRLGSAMQEYDKAVQRNPDSAENYRRRGLALDASGDHEAAIRDYDQAIRLKPDFAEAYSNRGIVRKVRGDLKAAILDLDQALRLKPDFAEAYYNRANVHWAAGDPEAAMLDLDQAIRLKPDFAEAYYNRAVVLEAKGDLKAAVADYDAAIRLNPDYEDSFYNRGLLLKQMSQPQAAIADLKHYLELGGGVRDGDTEEVEQMIRDLEDMLNRAT